MPYIDSKVSVSISKEKEMELKTRLGKAIECIPGKSESWLMTGFQDNYHLYFRGDDSEPMAFVEVKILGAENKEAFNKLTGEIATIFNDVLGIAKDHIYVKYEAVANWGWNGANF
jgi:phenylpyruvate tautomerase PptA (4-oxalocrotonate tautomerase family)